MGQLFQWASTLTTNGRNLPFALPQRVDRLENGFQVGIQQQGPRCFHQRVPPRSTLACSIFAAAQSLLILSQGSLAWRPGDVYFTQAS